MNFGSIESELISDDVNVGACIGISNSKTNKWRFSIYIGHGKLLVLYEKGKGINSELFDKLMSIKSLTKEVLMRESNLIEGATKLENLEKELIFDLYILNILNIKECQPNELIKILRFNLNQIETLEEGDIIKFERGLYSHQALLTDSSRMIVTHRSGEPENPVGSYVASTSLLGLPSDKAEVTEDPIIEVAGYRKMMKSNEIYDSLHLPRPREQIVKEAKRRIGEKGYSIMTKNCHHFVSECRNGTAYSPEVHGVFQGAMFFSAIALVAALVGVRLLNSSAQNRREQDKQNQ